jgi:hypothetical protein
MAETPVKTRDQERRSLAAAVDVAIENLNNIQQVEFDHQSYLTTLGQLTHRPLPFYRDLLRDASRRLEAARQALDAHVAADETSEMEMASHG